MYSIHSFIFFKLLDKNIMIDEFSERLQDCQSLEAVQRQTNHDAFPP